MKIDFKKLSKHPGYQSLKKAVISDCMKGSKCFNLSGCNNKKDRLCSHRPCEKFKWVIDRAKHYANKTGLDVGDIIDVWEENRSYWYQNYYQDSNQPKLTGMNVLIFNTKQDFISAVKICPGFRCPSCGKVTKDPYTCEFCDWKSFGLFGCLGKGVYIFIKTAMRGETIFYPIAWEEDTSK